LIGGVLASAHLIACHKLKEAALKKVPLFISNKTIINFYTTAVKVKFLKIRIILKQNFYLFHKVPGKRFDCRMRTMARDKSSC